MVLVVHVVVVVIVVVVLLVLLCWWRAWRERPSWCGLSYAAACVCGARQRMRLRRRMCVLHVVQHMWCVLLCGASKVLVSLWCLS